MALARVTGSEDSDAVWNLSALVPLPGANTNWPASWEPTLEADPTAPVKLLDACSPGGHSD